MENHTQGIKEKNFLDKNDLREILRGSGAVTEYMVRTFYTTIRQKAVQDLESKGMIVPAKNIIPAVYVWDYLKPYGITK